MAALLGGRYAIERRIGEGGMADVLLARDRSRGDAPVVIKRCKAHLQHQPEFAHLFLREARLATLIHHPNVVELFDTGDDDGLPYLVMEYLQGFTVRDVFLRATTEGGVPQDLAALIILGAARGLAAAHAAVDENGKPILLVHRDVSPHNLFVTDAGAVKVLDFGIAKGAHDVTMTRQGHVKGKASYLAPEQLVAGGKVDARADLFSLGIVSWELLTGKRLFKRASETDTINAIRTLRVPDPAAGKPELDREYASGVMRLLARRPEDRPQSAKEIVVALETAMRRRATKANESELARYIAHLRTVTPIDDGATSIPPAPLLTKEDRQKAFEEAWGNAVAEKAPNAMPAARAPTNPTRDQEPTATVAPPVKGAWDGSAQNLKRLNAPPDGEAAVDGSVVGTFAVAGAPSPDRSDGFTTLDSDDLQPEVDASGEQQGSKVESLPMKARPTGGEAEDRSERPKLRSNLWQGENSLPVADATGPSSAAHPTLPPGAPRPATDGAIERFLAANPALERLVYARVDPRVVVGTLAAALVAGVVVAYVITKIVG